MSETKGILTVLSGFSGSGKGTIMKRLLEQHPQRYALSISCTSRKPRPGEQEGREYFFRSEKEFEQMIAEGRFLEYARYVDHYYGTPADYVRRQLEAGKDVILEIELQGALQIREKCPDTLLLFVTPPSAEELARRLRGRGTESEDVQRARLERAVEEAQSMDRYDYIVVNDELETCVEEVHRLIQSQHARTVFQGDFIRGIRQGIDRLVNRKA